MRAHLSDFLCSLIGNYWEKEKKTARGHALFRGFIAQMDNVFMHDVQKEKGINLWGFLLFVFAGGWSVTHQLCTERAEICPWCWTKNPLGQIDEEGDQFWICCLTQKKCSHQSLTAGSLEPPCTVLKSNSGGVFDARLCSRAAVTADESLSKTLHGT